MARGARPCSRSCGPPPARRRASGSPVRCTAWSRSTPHDRVLRPAIIWNDQRTGAECSEIEATLGLARLTALTGNRALTSFTAPKLLWLRHHEPDVFARIARIALPKDYVRLRLCGEHATDVADASGTLLLDVAERRWSEEMLDALAFEREWLPRVLESPQVSGATADGVPVAAGAGDQAAGALGVGVDRPGPVSVVLGTSGVVFAALERYAADPQVRVQTFCHAIPGTWHAMGVMLSAAGSLRWLQAILGADYDVLTAEASAWAPTTEGLTFLPYLAGERTPARRPRRARLLHGPQPAPRPRRARARAARGRRLRPARLARPDRRARRAAGARACLGRRRAQRGVAANRRLGAGAAARARRGRGRGRVRRRAARRRRRRRLARRPRRGRRDRAPARADRAGARVDRALPRRGASASAPSTRRCAHAADAARRRRRSSTSTASSSTRCAPVETAINGALRAHGFAPRTRRRDSRASSARPRRRAFAELTGAAEDSQIVAACVATYHEHLRARVPRADAARRRDAPSCCAA